MADNPTAQQQAAAKSESGITDSPPGVIVTDITRAEVWELLDSTGWSFTEVLGAGDGHVTDIERRGDDVLEMTSALSERPDGPEFLLSPVTINNTNYDVESRAELARALVDGGTSSRTSATAGEIPINASRENLLDTPVAEADLLHHLHDSVDSDRGNELDLAEDDHLGQADTVDTGLGY